MLRLLLVLLWATEVIQGLAISHEDLEGGNRICGEFTCEFKKKDSSNSQYWTKKNCRCDHDCIKYGDCCRRSDFFNVTQQMSEIDFECVETDASLQNGFFMITTCPPSWEDEATRKLCMTDSKDDSDPINLIPVTSKTRTYRNLYCAACHGESNLDIWHVEMTCDIPEDQYYNPSVEEFLSKLNYDKQEKQWVHLYRGSFVDCTIKTELPTKLASKVRECLPNLVKTCDVSWAKDEIRSHCEEYTEAVFYSEKIFRNSNCAICNNIPTKDLDCFAFIHHRRVKPFSITFDVLGKEPVGKIEPCPDSEGYDVFFKKCRKIFSMTARNLIGH